MFVKFARPFLLALTLCAPAALAQTPPAAPQPAAHNILDVIQWVRRDGSDSIMSKDNARMFGWDTKADIVVQRMVFMHPENKDSVIFDVVREKPNAVMISRDQKEMIVWQMSDTGELLKTLRIDKDNAAFVDNAAYRQKWQDTLDIFIRFVPDSPPASPPATPKQ